jgi:hypothetical protein
MDIEIKEVQEIIKNLEDSGELSIKEEKYLKVAKLCVQMAAENVALKLAIPEPRNVEFDNDSMDDVSLAEDVGFNDAIGKMKINISKTPATDRIVAEIKADGVEMFVEKCREKSKQAISSDIRNNWWLAGEHADDFAKQLREGANHD